MKRISKILTLVAVASVFTVATSKAQLVVRVHPVHVGVFVRPAAPSPHHVWVENEWVERRGRYVERPGYWAVPPRPGGVWIAGHWADRPGGSVWIGGHWR